MVSSTGQVNVTGSAVGPFTHDDNGNLTSDGVKTYEWDAENRLVAVKQGGSTLASFQYDGIGRRSNRSAGGATRTHVWDGVHLLEDRLSAGGAVKYFDGPNIDQHLAAQDQAGTASYFSADHLGSVVEVTTSPGDVSSSRQYDPWGNASGNISGYAFTGREWDSEAQLYYYRARYYGPDAKRFLSEDPIGLNGGFNLYVYAGNSPVRSGDPFGLLPSVGDFFPNPFSCFGSTVTAFELARKLLVREFPGGDKRAHCLAFCELANGCGPFWGGFAMTAAIGFGKETLDSFCYYVVRDEMHGHFKIEVPCGSPWDWQDVQANLIGATACPRAKNRDCSTICSDVESQITW